MREVVFDTETTGLNHLEDRVIEIGGVELINRFPTGRTFHVYINPQGKAVHPNALAVHGISNEQLSDKPIFPEIIDDFLDFFDGAKLVAHNASFDMNFINAELERIGKPAIVEERIIDTLVLARRKHPMGPNSLDALCQRYGISNTHRTLHGALLDSEILAEIYIELSGGRQATFRLTNENISDPNKNNHSDDSLGMIAARPVPLSPRLSPELKMAHEILVEKIGSKAIWKKLINNQIL